MKYQLIEDYFQTELFQAAVQDYFDTVLGKMIAENTTLSAKGRFEINGEEKRDYYDMPYHIHILNGLIPTLFVYEKYLQKKGWIDDPDTGIYLRIFILGFTFHDANKIFGTKQSNHKSELENAISELNERADIWNVSEFLKDYEKHKSTIYFLALGTENGTAVSSGDYKISVSNWNHVSEIQRELCHLADGLASIQSEHLESIEELYKAIQKCLYKISKIEDIPVSYVKVRPNPYTLLSQNLLQVTRKELSRNSKKVLYATREGFIFWGEDISDEEDKKIEQAYLTGSEDDIKFLELTNIDAQKCKFGFIGSVSFTKEVLGEIVEIKANNFLALSPNSNAKISEFDLFIEFTKQIIEVYEIPVDYEVKDQKLTLRYKIDSEEETNYRTVYNLHKILWLNAKEVKSWKEDLDAWINNTIELSKGITINKDDETIKINTVSDLIEFIKQRVNTTSALYKTYLNFIKTHQILQDADDIDEYIATLQEEILSKFEVNESDDNVKKLLFQQYFEAKGNSNLAFLETYNPSIPIKKEMCAFTGAIGAVEYNEQVAFAMKARGFSNRTITALNNNTSHISKLFAEENKLRTSLFKVSDANLVVYHDFFETKLDIDREIIQACVNAKNELKLLKDGVIEFDKNSKFQYNLYNLEYTKLAPKIEPTFFLVRKCLRMIQALGIRSYISGIMTPYQPHKAMFHFENPPQFLKKLEWNSVRLNEIEEVLDEIRLVLAFGKNRIESNLLRIAQSRLVYFSIYYSLKDDDKIKVYNSLVQFYKKYKQKFSGMTVTEKLVELAVRIDIGFKSSAEETWLIRTALEYLRKYHKQDNSREDIIQKMCGEIFRKKRMDNPNMEAIKDFSTAIYDELFKKDWSGNIPTINREKDWIYQFAFLFREKSLEIIRTPKAKEIKTQLESSNTEFTEDNIRELLPKESKRNTNQYLEIIKKL